MNIEERCALLEEENRKLRDAMRVPDRARYPAKWRLNGAEGRVLASLLDAPAGFRSKEVLYQAARRRESTEIDRQLLRVVMSRLRKKLAPFGVAIYTVKGEGYKLGEESKAKIVGARTLGGAQ